MSTTTMLVADTNILIYFLAGRPETAQILHGKQVCVSCITELEIFSLPSLTDTEENDVRALLGYCHIIDLFPAIKELSVVLRRKYRLKLPDAIIAATALALDAPLASADRVFQRITEISFTWLEL